MFQCFLRCYGRFYVITGLKLLDVTVIFPTYNLITIDHRILNFFLKSVKSGSTYVISSVLRINSCAEK